MNRGSNRRILVLARRLLEPLGNWIKGHQLVFLFILSLCLRICAIIFFQGQFRASDAAEYIGIARNILSGNGYTLYGQPITIIPVYPIFLAAIFLINGQNLILVQLAQVLLGALTVLVVHRIARNLFPSKVAFWAGVIVSVHPWVIYWTGFILTETLFLFLLCCGVFLVTETMKTISFARAVALGVVFGLAGLCRSVGLLVFVMVLILSPLLYRNSKRIWPKVSVAVLAFLLVMFPWVAHNYVVFNAFIPISGEPGFTLYAGNNPNASLGYGEVGPGSRTHPLPGFSGLTEGQKESYLQNLALEYIYRNPLRFAELSLNRFYLFWSPIYPTYSLLHDIINCLIYLPLYVAAFWGMSKEWKNKPVFWLFFALLAVPTLVHSITIVDLDQRFRLPLQPFLAILAARGLVKIF